MYKLNKHTSTRKEKGIAHPGRSFKSSTQSGGTPGAKNPSRTLRSRTTSQGRPAPKVAKTPAKVKQGNPKGKRSVKSTPIGFKKTVGGASQFGIKALGNLANKKGGMLMPRVSKMRGGFGAARPNFGQAIRRSPLGPIGGR